jgi:hypothetical protein
MQEVWRDIIGYEGLYQVSNIGNVKGIIKTLKPNKTSKGYLHISLYKNRISKTFKLHRIVAQNFISNPENKLEVNHMDGNKLNNKIDNLEWNTRFENNKHAIDNKLIIVPQKGSGYWNKKYRGESSRKKCVIDLENGIYYDCMKDAADAKSITYSQLKNRLHGRTFNNTSIRYI